MSASETIEDQNCTDAIQTRVGDDTVVLYNENTTVGYARFSKGDGTIDYIFVNPAFRGKGYGRLLVKLCEEACGTRLSPAPPISPLGRRLFSRIHHAAT